MLVGVTGFEPAASASRTQRSTKLSHTPICHIKLLDLHSQVSNRPRYAYVCGTRFRLRSQARSPSSTAAHLQAAPSRSATKLSHTPICHIKLLDLHSRAEKTPDNTLIVSAIFSAFLFYHSKSRLSIHLFPIKNTIEDVIPQFLSCFGVFVLFVRRFRADAQS